MRTEILTVADPRVVGSSEMTGGLTLSPTRWDVFCPCSLSRLLSSASVR